VVVRPLQQRDKSLNRADNFKKRKMEYCEITLATICMRIEGMWS